MRHTVLDIAETQRRKTFVFGDYLSEIHHSFVLLPES